MCSPRASDSTSSGWAYSRSIRSRTRRSRRRSSRRWDSPGRLVTCEIVAGSSGPGWLCEHRQGEAEPRTDVELALHPDPAAVPLDDGLGDRQPEAGAAELAAVGVLHLVEAFEDRRELVLRDAASLVLDHDQDLVLTGYGADADGAAGLGELQGVAEQVDQCLHDPVGVAQG